MKDSSNNYMKFRIMTFGILLSFSLSSKGFASDDCRNVRLDKKGGPVQNVPIFDQRDLGNCYSIGTAEALDAYRFSHGEKDLTRRLSPLSLGIGAAVQYSGSGLPKYIYQFLSEQNQFCTLEDEKRILSDRSPLSFMNRLKSYVEENNQALKLLSLLIKWYGPNYTEKLSPEFKLALKSDYGSPDIKIREAPDQIACTMSSDSNASEQLKTLTEQVFSVSIADMNEQLKALGKLLKQACSDDIIKIDPNLKFGHYEAPHSLDGRCDIGKNSSIISALLNEPAAQPVIISYCADKLQGKFFHGVDWEGYGSCERHISIVIGQRSHEGRCEYLLRNSWGSKWCPPKNDIFSTCEGGQVWVSKDALSKQIYQIDSFSQTQTILPSFVREPGKP